MPDPGLLGRDDIVAALDSLAAALEPKPSIELIVVGGSYMALRELRTGTDDVDSVTRLDPPLRAAIAEVARQRDLDPEWLNDHAAPWAPAGLTTDDCDLVFEHGPLRILLPSADTVFLMKLAASRSDATEHDRADMRVLWPLCSFESPEAAGNAFAEAYPAEPEDPHLDEFIAGIARAASRLTQPD